MRTLLILVALVLVSCAHEEPKVAAESPEPKDERQISWSDWNRTLPKRFSEIDTDANGNLEGRELLGLYSDLPEADRNHDKKVSLIEFMAAAEKLFEVTDRNQDRKLTTDELQLTKAP